MATYDLYVQPKTPADINSLRIFTTGYNRSVGVRGPWKLVVQWMKRFMTTKGSDPLRPEEGTDFPNLIGANVTTAQDLRDLLVLALQDCNDQIYEVQQATQPDEDEMLESAVLDSFQLTGEDGFEAYVTITNVQGAAIKVKLPDYATR